MRVLVFEQWFLGHHYHYLSYLLPRLVEEVDEVVLAITPMGRASKEFESLLAPALGGVRLDESVPDEYRKPNLRDRLRLFGNLSDAVRRAEPDYVLVPSADLQTRPMGACGLLGRGDLPGRVPGEAGIHFGAGPAAVGLKRRAGEAVVRELSRHSSWRKLHFVNFLLHESMRSAGGSLARRSVLLPHPVPASPRIDKLESRRRLGLPEGGRIMGLLASIDERKAIPEWLAAFRAGAPRPDDRLLLAGRMLPAFAELIRRDYADLVDQGRVVVLDRFIDTPTVDLVLGSLDVVCTPYPRFGVLSATMLNGVAAGKPVLTNDFGWSRAMIRRFGFGWACDVMDHAAFAGAVREAFERSGEYRESEATRRLLEFHDPANFVEHWLAGLREHRGRPPSGLIKTWPWVLEALEEGRRDLR